MAAQYGRTTSKWTRFYIENVSGNMVQLAVSGINGIGLEYDAVDLTAFTDGVKGVLPGMPSNTITITGPLDTTTEPTSSSDVTGAHDVLPALVGGTTPLMLDVRIGIGHEWEAGEPTFGITSTTDNGYLCTAYTVNINDGTYSATFQPIAGSAAPAYAVAAHTT